jgi:hypothetical protein
VAAVRRNAHRCHIDVTAGGFNTGGFNTGGFNTGGFNTGGFHGGKGRAKMEATGMRLLTRN